MAQNNAKRKPLSLSAAPAAKAPAVKDRRGKKTVVFTVQDRRPAVIPFQEPPVSYAELFAEATKTSIGSHIHVIRMWMEQEGLPTIPERISIPAFASVCARFLLPRANWPHFGPKERKPAEVFIAEWSNKLFGRLLAGEEPKPKPELASWIVPEIAAFYAPSTLAAMRLA